MDRAVTPRVLRLLHSDFAEDADLVAAVLEDVQSGNQDRERMIAAVVLAASGSLTELETQIALSHVDWRDVLVNAELAHGDWRSEIDRRLGQQS